MSKQQVVAAAAAHANMKAAAEAAGITEADFEKMAVKSAKLCKRIEAAQGSLWKVLVLCAMHPDFDIETLRESLRAEGVKNKTFGVYLSQLALARNLTDTDGNPILRADIGQREVSQWIKAGRESGALPAAKNNRKSVEEEAADILEKVDAEIDAEDAAAGGTVYHWQGIDPRDLGTVQADGSILVTRDSIAAWLAAPRVHTVPAGTVAKGKAAK